MATAEQIAELKLNVGPELFTDDEFNSILDLNGGDMIASAAQVWEIRAGRYHGLVDISESGSSRKMSDMHKNALAMAANYRGQLVTEEAAETRRTVTRRIVRQ